MDENLKEQIRQHSAGAIVQHRSPFHDLKSFRNEFELTQGFLDQWVIPYYMCIGDVDEPWIEQLRAIKAKITPEIIASCLGDFNWRTRQTGAFFAAITNQEQFIDVIGTHLLKSEVCYAGGVYSMVFAAFNTAACVAYLNAYLEYYLRRPDLWFDQSKAMSALLYLDQQNGTHHIERHQEQWLKFLANKPQWGQEISTAYLEKQLKVIEVVRNY
jgi:Family of unknown function (DUF6000)